MMIRPWLKDAAAHAVAWSGLDAVARTRRHRALPFVVAYHRVVERVEHDGERALPSMQISVAMLEKHLDWLASHFDVLPVDDPALTRPASKPKAAVTFDDGYSDAFHHAFPLLRRKGIPAAFFVVTDLIGTDELPIHERLYRALAKSSPSPFAATRDLLGRLSHDEIVQLVANESARAPQALQPLSWDMLATMQRGGMTIGSHSRTHAFLTNEHGSRIREEVSGSKRTLEERLGCRIDTFAFPGGAFNATVVDAVAKAGYRYAFTICGHRDQAQPMLTIPRRGMWEQSCLSAGGRFSPPIMSCQAAGAFDRFGACTATH